MIYETLSFLASEVNNFLNLKLGVQTDPRLKIGNISRALDDSPGVTNPFLGKAILSLVNIEEGQIYRQQEDFRRDPATIYKSSPMPLNLYLLFAINKAEYDDALKWLAVIMQYFQQQSVFTVTTHPGMNTSIQKLVVELYALNLEQLNNLWSTLGVNYLPSALYKVMQTTLDEDTGEGEKEVIKEIQLNKRILPPKK